MTLQEIFDTVSTHLITQRAVSNGASGGAYRGFEGTKCAVGVLIKDEHYSAALEGRPVFTPGVRNALFASGVLNEEEERGQISSRLSLLGELQFLHDTRPYRDYCDRDKALFFVEEMKRIANQFGLNTDVVRREFPSFFN